MEEEERKQKGEDISVGLLNGLRREMRRGKREIGPEGGQSGRLGVCVCASGSGLGVSDTYYQTGSGKSR